MPSDKTDQQWAEDLEGEFWMAESDESWAASVTRILAEVRQQEREACAKECYTELGEDQRLASKISDRIRSRK